MVPDKSTAENLTALHTSYDVRAGKPEERNKKERKKSKNESFFLSTPQKRAGRAEV